MLKVDESVKLHKNIFGHPRIEFIMPTLDVVGTNEGSRYDHLRIYRFQACLKQQRFFVKDNRIENIRMK